MIKYTVISIKEKEGVLCTSIIRKYDQYKNKNYFVTSNIYILYSSSLLTSVCAEFFTLLLLDQHEKKI